VTVAAKLIRSEDGAERVLVDSAHFQALLDAASIAEHGLPDVKRAIQELRAALAMGDDYVDAGELLERYDAVHGSG
jgi:hypothetical protein